MNRYVCTLYSENTSVDTEWEKLFFSLVENHRRLTTIQSRRAIPYTSKLIFHPLNANGRVHYKFSQSLPNQTHTSATDGNCIRKCLAFRPTPKLIRIQRQQQQLVDERRHTTHKTHLIVPAFIRIVSLILTCSPKIMLQMIRLLYCRTIVCALKWDGGGWEVVMIFFSLYPQFACSVEWIH